MANDEQLRKIQELCARESRRLRGDPNIVGVGFGIKRRKGQIVPGLALVYIVRTKAANGDELKKLGTTPVPSEVEGFPTDVSEDEGSVPDENGPPTGSRGSRKEDPLVGGTSTTVLSNWHSFPTGFGTLGGICFDQTTGDALALSNAHVWGKDIGAEVIQPWIPTAEYLEAIVKLLTCGPVVSYFVDWEAPSPLTLGLAAGASAAWIAASASDAEDPNRWGQVAAPPPPGSRTSMERIHLKADLPEFPFAGEPYRTKTYWRYTRQSTTGTFQAELEKERENEHTLISKRVWTDRQSYHSGERVRICAEVVTQRKSSPDDYFVVAQCFPSSQSDRVVPRVLRPGKCPIAKPPDKQICFHGFPPPAKPGLPADFPFTVNVFEFQAQHSSNFVGPWPAGDPNAITILRILHDAPIRVAFPPTTRVTVEVFHTFRPITALAFDASGQVVDTAATTDEQGVLQTLELTGLGIRKVILRGGGGEGFLVGMCIDVPRDDGGVPNARRFTYTGHLDLSLQEVKDKWGVALFVQTVDNTRPGTDPTVAARTLGGITASANILSLAGCVTVMLLDHAFDVI